MTTFSRQIKNAVPVGMTPVPKYATWDDHRDAMRQEAAARRTAMGRRRVETVSNYRLLV
jgi:hypothetical protein